MVPPPVPPPKNTTAEIGKVDSGTQAEPAPTRRSRPSTSRSPRDPAAIYRRLSPEAQIRFALEYLEARAANPQLTPPRNEHMLVDFIRMNPQATPVAEPRKRRSEVGSTQSAEKKPKREAASREASPAPEEPAQPARIEVPIQRPDTPIPDPLPSADPPFYYSDPGIGSHISVAPNYHGAQQAPQALPLLYQPVTVPPGQAPGATELRVTIQGSPTEPGVTVCLAGITHAIITVEQVPLETPPPIQPVPLRAEDVRAFWQALLPQFMPKHFGHNPWTN